jgi:hypothetical protein
MRYVIIHLMCLFDTGKKLQNKEDLKKMGDIQSG